MCLLGCNSAQQQNVKYRTEDLPDVHIVVAEVDQLIGVCIQVEDPHRGVLVPNRVGTWRRKARCHGSTILSILEL